jgi:hypothetical protein
MIDIRSLADADAPGSLANRLRARRFALFERLTARLPRPLRILDIGGTNAFWEHRGWANRGDVQITLVNIAAEPRVHANIHPREGDASDLVEFRPGDFEVVFSNSVIEHLFTFERQAAMAREVRRLGPAYWVQTPNYWFPMEPHFHVPGWQWMPESLRVGLLRRRRCGWRGPCPDPEAARQLVREVRLLTRHELRRLFPEATLIRERFVGLTKSWVAAHGFPTRETHF